MIFSGWKIPFEHFQSLSFFLFKAITQSILGQNQHPGLFLKTREQQLSFGTLGLENWIKILGGNPQFKKKSEFMVPLLYMKDGR